jgi:hypothetical protein
VSQLEQRLSELRFVDGVEKVEHVRFSTGDQFWVRFNRPLDMQKLQQTVTDRGYRLIKFGGLISKLPRRLGEVLWNGVTHVIVKEISQWGRLASFLGFEPDGIGKIAIDLHGPYQIFIAMNEAGIQVVYDYLGVKYVPPPPPPPKPTVAPVKSTTTIPNPPAATPGPAGQPPSPPITAKSSVPVSQTPSTEKKGTT